MSREMVSGFKFTLLFVVSVWVFLAGFSGFVALFSIFSAAVTADVPVLLGCSGSRWWWCDCVVVACWLWICCFLFFWSLAKGDDGFSWWEEVWQCGCCSWLTVRMEDLYFVVNFLVFGHSWGRFSGFLSLHWPGKVLPVQHNQYCLYYLFLKTVVGLRFSLRG